MLTIERPEYIVCRYCDIDMVEQDRITMNFPLDMENTTDKYSYAFDMWYMCPLCGLLMPYGVPVSKEFYKKYREVYKTRDPYDQI